MPVCMHWNVNLKGSILPHTLAPLTQLPNCFCLPPVHWPGLNLPSPLTRGPVGRLSVGGAVPPAFHKEYGFCHTTATGTGSPPTRWTSMGRRQATVTRKLVVTTPPNDPPTSILTPPTQSVCIPRAPCSWSHTIQLTTSPSTDLQKVQFPVASTDPACPPVGWPWSASEISWGL